MGHNFCCNRTLPDSTGTMHGWTVNDPTVRLSCTPSPRRSRTPHKHHGCHSRLRPGVVTDSFPCACYLFQYCLETFLGRCPRDVSLDAIYVILDGCPDEDMQAQNQTFQALVDIMGLKVSGIRFRRQTNKRERRIGTLKCCLNRL